MDENWNKFKNWFIAIMILCTSITLTSVFISLVAIDIDKNVKYEEFYD